MRIRKRMIWVILCVGIVFWLSVVSRGADAQQWHDYYIQAEQAARQKDWNSAVTLLQQAITQEPQPARFKKIPGKFKPIQYFPYLALARAYHQLGRDDDAYHTCEQAKQYSVEPKFLIERCLINLSEDASKVSPETLDDSVQIDVPPSQPVIESNAKIAVLKFQGLMVVEELGEAVSEIFRTELAGFGDFIVIERGMVDQVLQEQQLQLTGAVDANTAIQIGKLTGAQFVIIGSIIKTGAIYTINARLIDAETGIAKAGDNVKGEGEEKIPDMVTELTEKLLYQPLESKL